MDRRTYQVFRQIIGAILVKPSLRLKELASYTVRKASTVKTACARLGYFLSQSSFPMEPVATCWIQESLKRIPAQAIWRYQGKAILVLDPTVYPKRSRRGKKGRQMQYVGKVKDPRTERIQRGYVDIWAGLALEGGEVLPVAKALYSSAHPDPVAATQNQVEDQVLEGSLALLNRLGYHVIAVMDRGLSHKERLIRMAHMGQDFVARIRGDLHVESMTGLVGPIEALLRQQPPVGRGKWKAGKEPRLEGSLHILRAKIIFSRSGRKGDQQEAPLTFVGLFPDQEGKEPLILATTLQATSWAQAQGIVRVYERRWGIEVSLETLKGWGLERFMVRSWRAIERALWLLTLVYVIVLAALYLGKVGKLRAFLREVKQILRRFSVLGKRLTAGKLREALGIDYALNGRDWQCLLPR